MAKSKLKAVKTPKKRSTKYGKLAAVCSKELAAKKAALVRAEKALAKAQRTHTELLSEVARLDMLDRSLKALINGTEAPQNVRYVYSYPQWVWYGNPYWNGNTWTLTVGSPQTSYVYNSGGLVGGNGNFQGGQFTTTNAINTCGAINNASTVTYPATSGNISLSSGTSDLSLSSSSLSGLSTTLTSTSSPSYTMTTTNGPSSSLQSELTIDLSTGATEEEPKAEAKGEESVTAEVGYGG
jgi:hypothetical protein